MTIRVTTDLVPGANLTRRDGLIMGGTRTFRYSSDSPAADGLIGDVTDYNIVAVHASIPRMGDIFHTNFPNLFLTEMDIEREEIGQFAIRCGYDRINTSLNGGDGTYVLLEVQTQQRQITTNTGIAGTAFEVQHLDEVQLPEVSALRHAFAMRINRVLTTDTPGLTAGQWIDTINSSIWIGAAPGTWLCTDASYHPLTVSTTQSGVSKYVMSFLFELEPSGWQPEVWFRDPLIGRPPDDIIEGEGH